MGKLWRLLMANGHDTQRNKKAAMQSTKDTNDEKFEMDNLCTCAVVLNNFR